MKTPEPQEVRDTLHKLTANEITYTEAEQAIDKLYKDKFLKIIGEDEEMPPVGSVAKVLARNALRKQLKEALK